ncbi:L,D-transpeptidase family protein [Immundisolibacter sp.]|uniref:L,D-transpeptidase family protein n=1 Tax=Immundisolibacter sp. TaxID=1934948 RepID=UPI003F84E102
MGRKRRCSVLLLALFLAGCMKEPVIPLPPPPPKETPPPRATAPGPRLTFEVGPQDQVIGLTQLTRVHGDQTLLDIGRRFHLGYDEMEWANRGVDVWIPGDGREVVLPVAQILPDAPRDGLVANVAARRLFHFLPADASGRKRVVSYPIGIGREAYPTPLGTTRVTRKRAYPDWRVPASVRRAHAERGDPLPAVVPGGPDNPIGTHVLDLGWPTYIIHSTNKPAGTGLRVTHGCLQLYPEDITRLYDEADVGSTVTMVNQPILVGWQDDSLLLEVHPALEEHALTVSAREAQAAVAIRRALAARGRDDADVDWDRVRTYVQAQPGYPLPILRDHPAQDVFLAQAPLYEQPAIRQATQPTPAKDAWYIDLGGYQGENNARKLVAQLRHLGPPVPARHQPYAGRHRVTAGPFDDRQEAERIAHRIRVELGLQGDLRPPGDTGA